MPFRHAPRALKQFSRVPEVVTAYRRTDDWLRLLRQFLGVAPPSFPYDLTLRDGLCFHFENRDEIKVFWNIFFGSSYHVDPDDRVIVDAGANIGLFAVWAAHRAPRARIVSLEPWPSTFKRLTRHLEVNRVADRVMAANLALAGEAGWRELLGSDGESCNNRLQPDPGRSARSAADAEASGRALARCETLEAVLDRFGIGALDLLKMDIEGGEHETLLATPTAVLRRIRKINLEYHEVPAHLGYSRDRLFAHLQAAGHVPICVIEDDFHTGVAFFTCAGR